MTTKARDFKRGDRLSPTELQLLGNPIDFIHEDHMRERTICALLDTIAAADAPNPEDAIRAQEFLREELPLHLEDEEQDLFPLLQRRCVPEYDIVKTIQHLKADHALAEDETPQVIAILDLVQGATGCLSEGHRAMLSRYAGQARRHMILENAIILRFAKLRLTAGDIATLRLRMMQRRGLDRLIGPSNVD